MAGANSGWPTSSQDWQIFRYAEVLLNYAEAAFELGKNADALAAIIKSGAGPESRHWRPYPVILSRIIYMAMDILMR